MNMHLVVALTRQRFTTLRDLVVAALSGTPKPFHLDLRITDTKHTLVRTPAGRSTEPSTLAALIPGLRSPTTTEAAGQMAGARFVPRARKRARWMHVPPGTLCVAQALDAATSCVGHHDRHRPASAPTSPSSTNPL